MKRLVLFALMSVAVFSLQAQNNKIDVLQNLEKSQPATQNLSVTATLKSASRLFGAKDDLTTVILIIPSGSTVTVLDADSTYLHVTFEENEGFILRRHAEMDKTPVVITQTITSQQSVQKEQPSSEPPQSRFSYLESKYGSNMAARLMAGKIWKGMNAEMVKDSWGTAEKINRGVSGNVVKEEWIFNNTWLYFENNTLVEWGPIKKKKF